jgi:hypothetical protein
MNDKQQFELFVQECLKTVLPLNEFEQIELLNRENIKGSSGQNHNFDILIKATSKFINLMFVVECKKLKSKATKKDMEVFSFRIQDINAHKGIFVTTIGFDKGAELIAKSKGIALMIAKDGTLVPFIGDPFSHVNCIMRLIENYPFFNRVNDETKNMIFKGYINNNSEEPFGTVFNDYETSRPLMQISFDSIKKEKTKSNINIKTKYLGHAYNLYDNKCNFSLQSILSIIILDTYYTIIDKNAIQI